MTSDERQVPLPAGSQPPNDNGPADPDRLDLLDRYWDAVTGNGYQRAGAIALDPARARTVDLLQTHSRTDTAGIPDAARTRIWRETVAAAGIPTRQEPPMAPSSTPLPGSGLAAAGLTLPASNPPNRRRPGPPPLPGNNGGRWSVPGGAGPSQPTGRAWWPRLQFAVAAVLILGLFATILAPMDDGRVGLFGGIDSTPTSQTWPTEFGGSHGHQLVPAFEGSLDLRLYQLTLPVGASFSLPAGPAWGLQGFTGDVEFASEGADPYPINATTSGGTVNGGTLRNIVERESQVWVFGLVPRETDVVSATDGATLREVGRQDVSTLATGSGVSLFGAYNPASMSARPLGADAPPPEAGPQPLPGSSTPGLVHAVRGQISIADIPSRNGPTSLSAGETIALDDIGDATVVGGSATQGDVSHPDTYYVVTVQPYVFGTGQTPAASNDASAGIPSIGYPEAFTGGGSLVDLPVSSSGHTVSLDRVTLASGSVLNLPAGSTYRINSVTGLFTVERANGSSPLSIDQPSSVDIDLGGGTITADQGEEATVTILTLAPEGTASLASLDGITVYPLTTYSPGGLRFETQQNVLLGSGPVPVDPEPVPPSTNTDDPQTLAANGTTMLL